MEDELGLPPPPEEPAPEDCCNNDCCPCVRDIYEQALQRHRTTVRLLKMRQQMKMKIGPHCGISIQNVDAPAPTEPLVSPPSAGPSATTASILGASLLTEHGRARGLDVRRVLLLELGLSSHYAYEPGDYVAVIAVVATTAPRELEDVEVDDGSAAEQAEDGESMTHQHYLIGDPPCTIAHTLMYLLHIPFVMYKCDISAPPSKALLHALAQFTFDEEEKEELLYLCGGAQWQREFYQRNILHQRPGLLEVLERPPLAHVLEHVPPQRERYYSIASSPLLSPSSVHLVFPVVEYTTPAPHRRQRHGLCTSWLHSLAHRHLVDARHFAGVAVNQLCVPDELQREDSEDRDVSGDAGGVSSLDVWIKPAPDFQLPTDPMVPLILVCAGSGIAPFRSVGGGAHFGEPRGLRGFLRHRKAMREREGVALGECWLFFGFRFLDGDFLFREELEAMQREAVLTRLITATSREAESCRVQDRIVEHGRDVHRLIVDRNAVVCGDAQGMAAGVHEALAQVIAAYGAPPPGHEEPHAVLAHLQRERRYRRDVWSARKTAV
ncbi:FAD binding domain containing protein [Acanthamoeba castellanii str. Neff]|uniref:FAD binding domain containing protein n=1 Tax=Acanthamoeba castellanii (strain ATCC 30010 / Neff) TaxID=1257118 RepID=L8H348_ACACF|nr:FAD binding domain containing protein [Acanthamoeba castellanii str. Neff]ELR18846.1 FAD binding domain containing protein [Acanthamoeba castellanii str. Neff]